MSRKLQYKEYWKSWWNILFKEELANKDIVTGDADSAMNEANRIGYEVNQDEEVVIVSFILHTL